MTNCKTCATLEWMIERALTYATKRMLSQHLIEHKLKVHAITVTRRALPWASWPPLVACNCCGCRKERMN